MADLCQEELQPVGRVGDAEVGEHGGCLAGERLQHVLATPGEQLLQNLK
jgi:hypothetical protein